MLLVLQAALRDCLSFDPFSFQQDGLAAPEVDVGGREIAKAFVIAAVIVMGSSSGEHRLAGLKAKADSSIRV